MVLKNARIIKAVSLTKILTKWLHLRKCEKEIKALANTLDHLKMRNKNYRDKFIQGAEGPDLEKKEILED